MQKNIITINGKKYDATTGVLIAEAEVPNVSTPVAKNVHIKTGTSIDMLPASHHKRAKPLPSSHLHHKLQRSATLRRDIVKKPVVALPVAAPSSSIIKDTPRKHIESIHSYSTSRVLRSDATPQSHVISKFSNVSTHVKKHAPLAVVAAPAEEPRKEHDEPTHVRKSERMFAHAMASASTPQHHYKKEGFQRKVADRLQVAPKVVSVASASLAVVLLAGFFAYQNVPQMSYQIAARNAGVEGNLPTKTIAGYKLSGPITYSAGRLVISFQSNSDERGYKIEQRASNWNSDALKSNFLAIKSDPYQTIQDKGRTIFTYGNGNATWVDGGVWYRIEGNDRISTNQILAIASSL